MGIYGGQYFHRDDEIKPSLPQPSGLRGAGGQHLASAVPHRLSFVTSSSLSFAVRKGDLFAVAGTSAQVRLGMAC
jgi:hypothetical protein